jgi:hypothetical protein
MSRPFQPAAVSDANGYFLQHPERKRPNEPTTSKPLGPAPKWLSKEERKVWKDLAKQCLPGVLMFSDRLAFEMLVVLTTSFRARAPMLAAERLLMVNLCARFALTPADRARVQVEQPKESKLNKFLNKPYPAPRPAGLPN